MPDYSSLLPVYENVFKDLYSNLRFKEGVKIKYHFQIVNYTCTNKNQFMRKHWHMFKHFSCIHYLQFDEEHSCFIKLDNKGKTNKYKVGYFRYEHDSNLGYAEHHLYLKKTT